MEPTVQMPHSGPDAIDAEFEAEDEQTPLRSHASPPYWQHHRTVSHASQTSLDRPPPITLRDRTGSISSSNGVLWAKSITIEDYVIVKGNRTGIGAYVVWKCKVQTLDVCRHKYCCTLETFG